VAVLRRWFPERRFVLVGDIGVYAWRWNIETTFQEARAHLGLETTRG